MNNAELVVDAGAILGEGPVWDKFENKLLWVDIQIKKIHEYDPSQGQDTERDLPARPGTVVPVSKEKKLVALQNGIHLYDILTGRLSLLADPEKHLPENRFNDGKAGPCGRFFVGSMDLFGKEGQGAFYRMDPDGKIVKIFDNMTIPNGLCWSGDGKKFFFTESHERVIWSFDYDRESGNLNNRKVVIKVPEDMGFPDGMTIDQEDKLWVAHYGNSSIARWDPESGELMEIVQLSVPNVTSCTFGNTDLDTLYITTARDGLSEDQLESFPESGGLFAYKPAVGGRETLTFGDSR